MALFGLFKNKEERDMADTFKKIGEMINPMGEADVIRDCQRIGALIHGKLSEDKLRQFIAGCKTLVAISDEYDDDGFIRSFVIRSSNLISVHEARDVYVYLAGEATFRNRIVQAAKINGHSVPSEHLAYVDGLAKIWARGTTDDTIPGGYGEFGLSLTNPIPTICVAGSTKYLAKLRYTGEEVESKRVGSTSSEVTGGNVDIYELSLRGREVGSVYICPYHRKDSKKTPKGFTMT